MSALRHCSLYSRRCFGHSLSNASKGRSENILYMYLIDCSTGWKWGSMQQQRSWRLNITAALSQNCICFELHFEDMCTSYRLSEILLQWKKHRKCSESLILFDSGKFCLLCFVCRILFVHLVLHILYLLHIFHIMIAD